MWVQQDTVQEHPTGRASQPEESEYTEKNWIPLDVVHRRNKTSLVTLPFPCHPVSLSWPQLPACRQSLSQFAFAWMFSSMRDLSTASMRIPSAIPRIYSDAEEPQSDPAARHRHSFATFLNRSVGRNS